MPDFIFAGPKYRLLWVVLGLVVPALVFMACSPEPTPVVVYITATPNQASSSQTAGINDSMTDSTQLTMAQVTPFQGSIPTITPTTPAVIVSPSTQTTLIPTITPTPTTTHPTASPTATRRPRRTRTPTPTPTSTPSPSPTPPLSLPDVPPAETLPIIQVQKLGIQVHPFLTQEEWGYVINNVDNLDAFGWIKFQLSWRELEPQPGQYSDLFYTYVQRVQWATFQGKRPYKVLLSVAKAPDWARPDGADLSQDGPPADPAHLARFLTDFINATKPEDNRIAAIEVWNEPNLVREWSGVTMDGQTYMRYFQVAHSAIKAIAPHIIVVTAGLAPVGDIDGAVSDRRFLEQMFDAGLATYQAQGVKIGVHPYGWANPPDEVCCQNPPPRGWADNPVFFFQDTLNAYAQTIAARGPGLPMWITEFGWGTYDGILPGGADAPAPPSAPYYDLVTVRQQAEYIMRAIDLIQQNPQVEVAFLWNLNFAMLNGAVERGEEQAGFSLLNAEGVPRLVYYYIQVARKQLE